MKSLSKQHELFNHFLMTDFLSYLLEEYECPPEDVERTKTIRGVVSNMKANFQAYSLADLRTCLGHRDLEYFPELLDHILIKDNL